jgi:hypothetical protein
MSVLLSFSCSSFACIIKYVQRCLSITVVVKSSCGPTAIHQKAKKSTRSRSFEEPPWTLHLRAQCGPLYRCVSYVASALFSKLEHFITLNSAIIQEYM